MAKVYCWKIDSNNYGYLYVDGKTHISQKITEKSVLDGIINHIKGWSREEAYDAFEEMRNEVRILYPNKDMVWSDDYWTTGGVSGQTTLLISGSDNDSKVDIDSILADFMTSVNAAISSAKTEIESTYRENVERLNAKITGVIGEVNDKVDEALNDLGNTKADLINKIDDAKDALDDVKDWIPSGVTPDKIIDVVKKVDDIPPEAIDILPHLDDKINDIDDTLDDFNGYKNKVDDYDDRISDIEGGYHVFNDWVDPVKDEDPTNWKRMFDNYDTITKKLKNMGLYDMGPDDDTFDAMYYFSNALVNLSGETLDNSNKINNIDENIDGVVSGKVQEIVFDSVSGIVQDMVTTSIDSINISGQVQTMISASLEVINESINTLSGRVGTIEREMDYHDDNSGGGNSPGGSIDQPGMSEQSSNAPVSNTGCSFTNASGFTIEMTDSAITLSNGSGATNPSKIIITGDGIILSGRITISGSTSTFGDFHSANEGPQLNP